MPGSDRLHRTHHPASTTSFQNMGQYLETRRKLLDSIRRHSTPRKMRVRERALRACPVPLHDAAVGRPVVRGCEAAQSLKKQNRTTLGGLGTGRNARRRPVPASLSKLYCVFLVVLHANGAKTPPLQSKGPALTADRQSSDPPSSGAQFHEVGKALCHATETS